MSSQKVQWTPSASSDVIAPSLGCRVVEWKDKGSDRTTFRAILRGRAKGKPDARAHSLFEGSQGSSGKFGAGCPRGMKGGLARLEVAQVSLLIWLMIRATQVNTYCAGEQRMARRGAR